MNMTLPDIPTTLAPGTARMIAHEANLEELHFKHLDLTAVKATNLSLSEVVLEKCMLVEAYMEKLRATDVRIEDSDLSAANCTDASLIRVTFTKGRMAGLNVSGGLVRDVIFTGCKLDLANFRHTKLTRVQFVDCSFIETDFIGAELNQVSFAACTLEKTAFDQCKAKDVDLRGAQIVSLSGWQSLKGSTIDVMQLMSVAPQIALELGLKVTD
jgi:uncharacterized protein YjbI with pentapeptide repeats